VQKDRLGDHPNPSRPWARPYGPKENGWHGGQVSSVTVSDRNLIDRCDVALPARLALDLGHFARVSTCVKHPREYFIIRWYLCYRFYLARVYFEQTMGSKIVIQAGHFLRQG
jgi:hypothetical protein